MEWDRMTADQVVDLEVDQKHFHAWSFLGMN